MKSLIGIRNHFKAPAEDGGYHHGINNGPYVHEAMEKGYLLKDAEGQLVRITNAEFPRGTLYMLDARNPGALSWFLEGHEKWEADGYKEDAMVYTKHYRDGNWNPLNEAFMDRGCPTIVRSTAYSAPGDVSWINDTYYGKGEGFHFDQDRVPINLLNYAASGVSNLYPDITGERPRRIQRSLRIRITLCAMRRSTRYALRCRWGGSLGRCADRSTRLMSKRRRTGTTAMRLIFIAP